MMSLGDRNPQEDSLFAILSVLEKADPERTTNRDVRQQIEEILLPTERRFDDQKIFYADDDQLFLGNKDLTTVYESLGRIEQNSIREAVSFLEDVVRRRQSQDDLWPDGRLELGLAYAALGDYEQASRVLTEVIEICESGGKYHSQNMPMAA
jgi:hypothetical protein